MGRLFLGLLAALVCSTAARVSPPKPQPLIQPREALRHALKNLDEAKKRGLADGVVNVHLVPHTHDDVGWLKTVDQYFAGKNESIQQASVHQLISSVMDELAKNSDRKFIYVESAFFWRWWREQTEDRKAQVQQFVKNGQLEFINGGWCMHDEAATHFQSMIDQTTEGHQFLKETFNVTPVVQWQIDPFGHSNANAELSVQMGMDSVFFMRADYADIEQREQNKGMEMMWYPSKSMPDIKLLAHILYEGYGPPPGFDWNVYSSDEPIQDDPNLEDFNVPETMARFLADALDRASRYMSSNILMTMGSDFHYRQAADWFDNIDKLIKYSKQYLSTSVNVFYSTPSIYTRAVLSEVADKLPLKKDDFFPYGDGPHSYWTGYFTSRPALKRYERYTMGFLQACKQIEARANKPRVSWALREAMGVAQHHDAVSGTEKQHVAFDYAKRISHGIDFCETMMGVEAAHAASLDNESFFSCHLLNVSACAQTITPGENGITVLAVYNSLAQNRTEIVAVPVSTNLGARATGADGTVISSQVVPANPNAIQLGWLEAGKAATGNFTMYFAVSVPALGRAFFSLNFTAQATHPYDAEARQGVSAKADSTITNNIVSVTVSGKTGRISSVSYKPDSLTVSLDQNFLQYYSSVGDAQDGQSSGAYIFRPNQQSAEELGRTATVVNVFTGPLVQEIHQDFGANITQVIRVIAGKPFVELEWIVGPIGCHDGWGKEIISRLTTNVDNDGVFFTDSNGREMQQRTRDHRDTWQLKITEPVSQNYYPVNTAAYIEDSNARVTVVTDRSQGGASLDDGQLEIMVHRHTVRDDSRGVGEPIAEPGVDGRGLIIRGKHYIIVSAPSSGPNLHKQTVLSTTYEPVLMFSALQHNKLDLQTGAKLPAPSSSMQGSFPENAHLLTLQAMNDDRSQMLVRVNHLFEVGEGSMASNAVVSLDSLFPSQTISAEETTLTANQKANIEQELESTNVTLAPMNIRTFLVNVQ